MRWSRVAGGTVLLAIAIVALSLGLMRLDTSVPSFTATGAFTQAGEYPSGNTPNGIRYGSWNGSDAKIGTLTSTPFRAGFGIAMLVDGYPANAGNGIFLERVDTGRRVALPIPNTGESWQEVIAQIPVGWIGSKVRLVAVDGSSENRGWLGLAGVRRAGLRETLATDGRLRLFVFMILTFPFLLACLGIAATCCRRLSLSAFYLFPVSLLIAGVAAEAMFFVTMINTTAAAWIVISAMLAGSYATIRKMRDREFAAFFCTLDAVAPFLVLLAAATASIVLLSLTLPAVAPMISFLPQLGQLPPDNWLPDVFANHVALHLPPKPFYGDWLSSDRPPLQSGFDLISMTIFGGADSAGARYEAVGILLQATAYGMIYVLCRAFGAGILRSLGIVAFCIFSGFFYANTVYVWPKFLAATYAAASLAIALAPGKITLTRAIAISCGFAFGMLSHGGVAFTIPALMIALLVTQRRSALAILTVCIACFVVVSAPWSWYQHFYDPPGDRLFKWHLAGHIAPTPTPLTALLVEAYTTVPPSTLIANKRSNVRFLFDGPADGTITFTAAQHEFFIVRYGIGIFALPFLAALALVRTKRFRNAGIAAWIALASTVVWCAVMYLPNSTSIHQGSYLTMILIFVAGGLVLTEWWPLAAVAFACQAYDFVHVWVGPYLSTSVFESTSLVTLAGCLAIFVFIGWCAHLLIRAGASVPPA